MSAPPPNPFGAPSNSQAGAPHTPRANNKKWIWLVAGAVALVFTGIMFAVVAPQLGDGKGHDEHEHAAGEHEHEGETGAEGGVLGEFAWPANMATGGIIFTGSGAGSGIDIVRSDAPSADTGPAYRDAADLGEKALIHLYLDYRCPYCALFEEANQQTLEQVVSSGAAALEVHPLTFLDRLDEADAYSSRTAGAVACVASEQPEAAWAAHLALGDPAFQPSESEPGRDNDAIIAAIDGAVGAAGQGGLGDEARACITEDRYATFAKTLNDWWFANPVPGSNDLKVQGTPFAVIDGVPYEGDPRDGAAFAHYLEQQGIDVP